MSDTVLVRAQKRAFFLIIFAVILLDQLSKWAVRHSLKDTALIITSFFDLSQSTNTGVSFGLLRGYAWLPTLIAFVVIIGALVYYERIPKSWSLQVAFALIVGGATGNLIDRLLRGAVTDFIHFSFWPSFNLADSAIVVGGLLILLDELRGWRSKSIHKH